MRLAGRITEWNDDKGYGFVVPNGGGARAFVHINEFQRGSRRPEVGDLISYLPAVDARGRARARQVRHAGQRIEVRRMPSRLPRIALGVAALSVVSAALAFRVIPLAVGATYLLMSGIAYAVYWMDKSAANASRQRVPELHLHLVGLLGGWPGALVAQQQFRHKTAKASFQAVFWITVALNLAACAWVLV